MGIKKGTKLTDSPKDKVLRVRIDEDTDNKLKAICKNTNKSKSEVVRDGIDEQYARIKK